MVTLTLAAVASLPPESLEIVLIDYRGGHLRTLDGTPGVTYIAEHQVDRRLPSVLGRLHERAAVPGEHPQTLMLIDDARSFSHDTQTVPPPRDARGGL